MTVLLDEAARGVYPIMATPFTDLEEIDWTSADRLVDFYLDHEELTQLLRRTDRALQRIGLRLPALREN